MACDALRGEGRVSIDDLSLWIDRVKKVMEYDLVAAGVLSKRTEVSTYFTTSDESLSLC